MIAVVRRRCDLEDMARVVTADLTERHTLEEAFRNCTAVVHTAGLAHVFGRAATDEDAFRRTNVTGTETVANAARAASVPHLVLASSVSVYGGPGQTGARRSNPVMSAVDETAEPHPRTAYARSKLESERVAAECFGNQGYLTVLRLATLYGEGDRGNVARLIESLRRGRFIWPGDGLNRKSLIQKDDAARACIAAVEQPASGIYNVSAPPASMREIVDAICDALKRPVPRGRIPGWLLLAMRSAVSHIPRLNALERQLQTFLQDDVYCADEFRRTFNWRPETDLADGIALQVRASRK